MAKTSKSCKSVEPKRLTTQGVLGQTKQPMYAVLKTGGKQYKVQAGDIIQIEKLETDKGGAIEFKEILFACKPSETNPEIFLGKPLLAGASVKAEVVGQGRGDKVMIVKMKRRKQYRRTKGHRQEYTQVLVTAVNNGSGASVELSSDQKKAALAKFQSHLMPRGGKVKAIATASAEKTSAKKATTEKKAAAPKKAAVKK